MGPCARRQRPQCRLATFVAPAAWILISRPPAWTVQLGGPRGGGKATNVEGVAFGWDSHDLNLLAENRDVYFVPASVYER